MDKKTQTGKVKVLLAVGILGVMVPAVFYAANSSFLQSDWSGGSSVSTAVHPTNQSGWIKYDSKDTNIDTSQAGKILLTPTSGSVVDTTSADFNDPTAIRTNVQVTGTPPEGAIQLKTDTNDKLRPTLGKWGAPTQVQGAFASGAAAVYVNGVIYAWRGNFTRDFVRYDPALKKWDPMAPTPKSVSWGADLVYPGSGNYIYGMRGYSSKDFWRYRIVTDGNGPGDTWEPRAPTLNTVSTGGSLVVFNSDTLYATRGNGTSTFWKYLISTDIWSPQDQMLASSGGGTSLAYPGSGGFLYCLRGNDTATFYRYDTALGGWSTVTNAPYSVNDGARLVPGGDDFLYATFAVYGSQSRFARYSAASGWQILPLAPFLSSYGSDLTAADTTNRKIYALPGYGVNPIEMPSFDTVTQRWDRFSAPGGYYTNYHGYAYVRAGNAIYSVDETSSQRKFYKFDIATEQWSELGIMPGNGPNSPQSDQFLWTGAGTPYQDSIYWLCNGGADNGRLYRYSISGGTWTLVANPPTAGLSFYASGLYYPGSGNMVYVIGIYENALGAYGKQFYKYDLNSNAWTPLPDAPAAIWNYHGIVKAEDGYLYVLQGYNSNKLYRFNLASELWDLGFSQTMPVTVYMPSWNQGSDQVMSAPGDGFLYINTGQNNWAYKYNLSTQAWTTNHYPAGSYYSAQYYPGSGDYIYISPGNSATFYRYNWRTGAYQQLGDKPLGTTFGWLYMPDPAGDTIYFYVNSDWPIFMKYSLSAGKWVVVPCSEGQGYGFYYGSDTIRIGDKIYALLGGSTRCFYRYDITGNVWQMLQYAPASVGGGGYLAYPGSGDFIYALRGGGTRDFWQYSISNNTWTSLPSTLSNQPVVSSNAAMAAMNGNLYVLHGWGTNAVSRYSISGGAWTQLAGSPRTSYSGTEMIYPGSGNLLYVMMTYDGAQFFYAWDPLGSWTQKAAYPRQNQGYPSFTTDGTYLYSLDGQATPYLYRYTLPDGPWVTLANAPDTAYYEGQIEWGGPSAPNRLFAWRGQYDWTYGWEGFTYSMLEDRWDSPSYDPTAIRYEDWSGSGVITPVYYNGTRSLYLWGWYGGLYQYNLDNRSWQKFGGAPYGISYDGGYLHYPESGDYIYAIPGYYSPNKFMRFSLKTKLWEDLSATAPVPAQTYQGCRIIHGNDGYLYVTRGWNTNTFWRYNLQAGQWDAVFNKSVPAGVYYGADLEYVSTNNSIYCLSGQYTTNFYRYDVGAKSWQAKAPVPVRAGYGTALSYPGIGNYLYAVLGDSRSLFRYNIQSDLWEEMEDLPRHHYYGDMAYGGDGYFYLLEGQNNYHFLYRYNVMASGEFTSRVLGIGFNAGFGLANWNDTANSATSLIRVSARTSDSPTMSGAVSFNGYAGKNQDISNIPSVTDKKKYLQYKVELKSSDLAQLTEFRDITFNYDSYPASQTLTSSAYNLNAGMGRIMKLSWAETLLAGSDIRFQLRSSPDGSSWGNWLGPTGTTSVVNDFTNANDYASSSLIKVENGSARLMRGLEEFKYQQPLVVDNTGGSSGTNRLFHVTIPPANNAFWSNVRTDGNDIRLSDGTSELSYLLNAWDYTQKKASVVGKLSSIAANEKKTVYLLYGSTGASSKSDATNTGSAFFHDFSDPGIDSTRINAGGGIITQNGEMELENDSSAWDTYAMSAATFDRVPNRSFYAKIKPSSGSTMIGWHDSGTGSSYTDLVHAIYFAGSSIYIYEDGSSRGSVGSFTPGNWYEVKMTLLDQGATYFYRPVGQVNWNVLYNSAYSTESPLKVGITHYEDYRSVITDDWTVADSVDKPLLKSYLPVVEEQTTSPTLGGSWGYREAVTLTNSTTSALTNALIRLDLDKSHTGFWQRVQNDGEDIRLVDSDNTTLLSYFVNQFDYTNKSAGVTVKIPSLPAASSKTIYLYYGNAGAVSSGDATLLTNVALNGLVGYWKFDEASGTTASDSSGSGKNGTLMNDPTWVTSGKYGGALSLDGLNDYVDLPTTTLSNWDQLTMSAWVKAPRYTGTQWPAVIGSYVAGTSWRNIAMAFWKNSSALHLEVDTTNASGPYLTGQIGIPWDQWFHVTLVYDGATSFTSTEYLNGVKGNSRPLSGSLNLVNCLRIGSESCGLGAYLKAQVDDVRIYNRALSGAEVQELSGGNPNWHSFSYNQSANTITTGIYDTSNPVIQPIYGAFYNNDLFSFQETSTKPTGADIKYQVSPNGYTWYWWDGSSWKGVSAGFSQANRATDIQTNLASFMSSVASSGEFFYRAYLHSDNGSATPLLDQVAIGTASTTSYYLDASGMEAINSFHRDALNDQWVQYKATLFSSGENTPILDAVTLEYSLPSLALSSPTGGQFWKVGTTQNITWSANSDVLNDLVLEYNPGTGWKAIPGATNLNSITGTPFAWAIPNDVSSTVKVRVRSASVAGIQATSATDFTIYDLKVTSPNGSESLPAGSQQTITWTHSGLPGATVKLLLSTNSGNSFSTTIATGVAKGASGSGSYAWTVNNILSNAARVQVVDESNGNVLDASDADFAIGGSVINVTTPTAGEVLGITTIKKINWVVSGPVPNGGLVKLEYSSDGKANNDPTKVWNLIDSGYSATGTVVSGCETGATGCYDWAVPPAAASNTVVLRISDDPTWDTPPLGGQNAADGYSAVFRVAGNMTVISPNGGEKWAYGVPHTIKYQVQGAISNVKISYSTDNFQNSTVIVASTPNTGTHPWTPSRSDAAANMKIRVENAADSGVKDDSNTDFAVTGITITAPNTAVRLKANDPYTITWTQTAISNVKIEYSMDGGTNFTTIANSQPVGNNTYPWTLPLKTTAGFQVRISDADPVPPANDTDTALSSDISDVSSAIYGKIQVTYPNGLENLSASNPHNITWTVTPAGADVVPAVKIFYTTSSFAQQTVEIDPAVSKASNNNPGNGAGKYTWIPVFTSPTVKVRVVDTNDPAVSNGQQAPAQGQNQDDSDTFFSINGVSLASPLGGESWVVGSQQPITFGFTGTLTNVKLEYSPDGGANWKSIDANLPVTANPKIYNWTIPDDISTNVKVRVTQVNADGTLPSSPVSAISSAFTITGDLMVNSPGTVQVGQIATVSWTKSRSIASVDVLFSPSGTFSGDIQTVATGISGSSVPWNVPDNIGTTGKLRVVDTDAGHPPTFGDSPAFAIKGGFSFVNPSSATAWAVNENQTVNWTTLGTIGTVSLEYATEVDNYTLWAPIVATTTNDGSETWSTIPDLVSLGNNNPNPPTPLINPTNGKRNVKVRLSDLSHTGNAQAVNESPVFTVKWYLITYNVQNEDAQFLSSLSVIDSETWNITENSLVSPLQTVRHYRANPVSTTWTAPSYSAGTVNLIADADKTVTVLLTSNQPVDYDVNFQPFYDPKTDLVTIKMFLTRRGLLVNDNLMGSATMTVYNGTTPLANFTDTTPDLNGTYDFSFDASDKGLSATNSYLATTSILYNNGTKPGAGVINITLPTETKTIDTKLGNPTDTTVDPTLFGKLADVRKEIIDTKTEILQQVGGVQTALPTIESKVDTAAQAAQAAQSAAESSQKSIADILTATQETIPQQISAESSQKSIADILTATQETIPQQISAVAEQIEEIEHNAEILNREKSVVQGEKLTMRYQTLTGLAPTLDMYDSKNTLLIAKAPMREITTTGIYEYEIEFLSDWELGDFTVICSEESKGTTDAMVISVVAADISKVAEQVSAILGTTSGLSNVAKTTALLNGQFTMIETALDKISKDAVAEIKGEVASKSALENVYNQLTTVAAQIEEMSGSAKVSLQTLYEVSAEKKDDIEYLKNTTQRLKATMELTQEMVADISGKGKPVTQTWFEYK